MNHRLTTIFVLIAGLGALASTGCTRASADAVADSAKVKEIRQTLLVKSADTATTSQAEAGPAGYRSLKGRFVLGAGPVEMKLLAANIKPEEREVCAPGGQMPRDNSLRVDSATRAIADVVVFARRTKSKHESALMPSEKEQEFDQKACLFLSPVLVAQLGQTILVKNSDPVGHNTNIAGTSFNQIIPSNQSAPFAAKSQTETATEVSCNIHPWMKAYMWFRKDGYFDVTENNGTENDGTFEIPNLPAGELIEFQVWHPRARNGLVLNKPELKWDQKGRFKLKLEPGMPEDSPPHDLGTLEVPAALLTGG